MPQAALRQDLENRSFEEFRAASSWGQRLHELNLLLGALGLVSGKNENEKTSVSPIRVFGLGRQGCKEPKQDSVSSIAPASVALRGSQFGGP